MLHTHLVLASKPEFAGHDKQSEDEDPEHVTQVASHEAH